MRDAYLSLPVLPCDVDEVDDLRRVVVYVDDDEVPGLRGYVFEDVLYERFAGNGEHGLRHSVGEGLEACAFACCENHCFHSFSCFFVVLRPGRRIGEGRGARGR